MAGNRISFSQFHMWKTCPRRWKLKYIDKVGTDEPGVAALFGTAMHETLQEYLDVLYNKSVSEANSLNLNENLKNKYINSINNCFLKIIIYTFQLVLNYLSIMKMVLEF